MTERPEHLHVKLTADEKRMLRELAARQGLTASTQVRLMVRDEYQRQEPKAE